MTASPTAWMPLYVGDYLGDTQRLTTEQHGAYLLLMMDYWRNGPAPDDDATLQQITKLDKAAWKRTRPVLARMFQIEDGEWKHKRIDRELENARSNASRRSDKAKKAAQARWEQSSEDAPSNAPSMPEALPVECPPPSPCSVTFSNEKDNSAPASAEKQFWANAKSYLSANGVKNPGAVINKWLKDNGQELTRDALNAAQLEHAVNPIAYCGGVFRKRAKQEEWEQPC